MNTISVVPGVYYGPGGPVPGTYDTTRMREYNTNRSGNKGSVRFFWGVCAMLLGHMSNTMTPVPKNSAMLGRQRPVPDGSRRVAAIYNNPVVLMGHLIHPCRRERDRNAPDAICFSCAPCRLGMDQVSHEAHDAIRICLICPEIGHEEARPTTSAGRA